MERKYMQHVKIMSVFLLSVVYATAACAVAQNVASEKQNLGAEIDQVAVVVNDRSEERV